MTAIIDLADFQFISDNFLKTVAPGTLGDVNRDGVVNAKDYRLWQQEFSALVDGFEQDLTQAPEPSSLVYVVLAIGAFWIRRRLL